MLHKCPKTLLALALTCVLSAPHAATVSCNAQVTGCDFASDGAFPSQGQAWQTETAWWEGLAGTVTFDLGGTVLLKGLEVSLDNNDSYQVQISLDGTSWTNLVAVAINQGSVGWGMDRFSTDLGSPFFLSSLAFAPTEAAYLRLQAIDGDNLYSVGEVSLNVSAVPEASAVGLLAAGLVVVGGALRARRRPTQA
jgi:hypothetical protein